MHITIQIECLTGIKHNLKRILAHRIAAFEVEQTLSIRPILIYEQDADGEDCYAYYGETASMRMLAIVLTERDGWIPSNICESACYGAIDRMPQRNTFVQDFVSHSFEAPGQSSLKGEKS